MDESYLDKKFFIDEYRYNCPFCNRRSVVYVIEDWYSWDWSKDRRVYAYLVKCAGCSKRSAHYSNYSFVLGDASFGYTPRKDGNAVSDFETKKLDSYFFHHQPSSFFTINSLIPENIRELVSEADGCRKMNFLVGASGALRKAIYEFIKNQEAEGDEYQDKIKWLKAKYPNIFGGYFDSLSNIQDMTSENLHEKYGSFEPWTSEETEYLIEVVKAVLDEIYVKPKQQSSVIDRITALKGSRSFAKKEVLK